MISVILERSGHVDHSYAVDGKYYSSLGLWRILNDPAMTFLNRMKREYPRLAFKARIKLIEGYINDEFVPELSLELLSSNDSNLAQRLLQQFVNNNQHLVSE